jgi:hypothetical protein
MAVFTLEKLINGQADIVENYNEARHLWEEIKQSNVFNEVDTLAQELTNRQLQFEHRCGGRWIGQEIMALVGIGQYYSSEIGFDATLEDALKVKAAFARSYCSLEVKWHAEKAVKIFGLTENDEL